MEFIPIGIYGRFASVNGATNCHLVKGNGFNVVIDMGSGAFKELQKVIDGTEINALILTHLHYDHIADALVYQYYLENKQAKQVELFLPSFPNNINELFTSYKFKKSDIENIGNMPIDIKPIRVKHAKNTDSYMLKIKGDNSTLLYTSDFCDIDEYATIVADVDIVVADACVVDKDMNSNSPHASIGSIARMTPSNAILYLTHLPDGREKETLAEARLYHENSHLLEVAQSIKF